MRGFLRERRAVLAVLAGWSVVEAGQTFFGAFALAKAVDQGFLRDRPAVGAWWLALAALCVPVGAFGTARVFRALAALVEPLRDRLVETVVRRGVRAAVRGRATPHSSVVSRLTHQVEIARDAFGGLVLVLRSFAFTTAAALAGMCALAPMTLLIVVPPLAAGIALFAAALRPLAARQHRYLAADEALAAELGTLAGGLRDIRACGAEEVMAERARQRVDAELRAECSLARWGVARAAAPAIGGRLPVVLLLVAAPWLLSTHRVTAGALLGTLTYLTQSLQPALQNLVHTLSAAGTRLGVVLERVTGGERDGAAEGESEGEPDGEPPAAEAAPEPAAPRGPAAWRPKRRSSPRDAAGGGSDGEAAARDVARGRSGGRAAVPGPGRGRRGRRVSEAAGGGSDDWSSEPDVARGRSGGRAAVPGPGRGREGLAGGAGGGSVGGRGTGTYESVPRAGGGVVLRFEGVTFAYGAGARPVVRALDLDVAEGEHLAVVGPSGIGKSTVAGLAAGLLRPDAGRVVVAGRPALVPQEAYVFGATVGDNLRYLRPGADEAEVLAAAETVGAGPLVAALGGLGGQVEPAALSAGERQLLALARTYLSPAPLVLLDEATCHLDPAAEAVAERAFAARPGGTLVVVAHRISSARRAGRVLVLDGTHAVHGTHEDLPTRSPLYRDLVGGWSVAGLTPSPPPGRS
nr:ABC transporter ATP-binding protein [Streptomyces sp. HPF1205]